MTKDISRRNALACMGLAAGTVFAIDGGVFTASSLAAPRTKGVGKALFVQISDTHVGFKLKANPDVDATFDKAVDQINAMAEQPRLLLHTGDITHLAKPDQFDLASQHLSRLKVGEVHLTPGEHDIGDGTAKDFMGRFGKASGGRGYYSFDQDGVHFVCLVNVMNFAPEAAGSFGAEQVAWLKDDLAGRSASQPVVLFAHMPMWDIYTKWGWDTGDADQVLALVRRFGSVTILNGHIHQIAMKTEGNVVFHTARSTAYPQPSPGTASGPGPLTVPADALPRWLGVTTVRVEAMPGMAKVEDATLA